MPHFDKYAYEDTDCYGPQGQEISATTRHAIPISTSLTKREIEAGFGRLHPRKNSSAR